MDKQAQATRNGILEEMGQIERLRQGTLSEQYYGTGANRRGPYYILQGYAKGRHWSRRVPREHVEQVRADLAAGVRFQELCRAFAETTEQSTLAGEASASKKKARRRKGNASGRPPRS
jgi:hypothetical protein